jgi:predicted nucleic acid-binding protein
VGFLLDTCLLSEAWKPAPNGGVLEWLASSNEEELFLSVLSLGELKTGIDRLPPGKKRERLSRDYVALRSRFSSRVLAVNDVVAERWAALTADAIRAGKHVHVVDGLLAATALVFGLTVVTRNVGDFVAASVPVLDPWTR